MKIKIPALSTMSSDSYSNLNTDIKDAVMSDAFIYGKIKGYFDATYLPAATVYSQVYKTPKESALTIKIKTARYDRTEAFRVFRQMIKLNARKDSVEIKDASDKVNILLKGYEGIVNKSLTDQTGLVDDLLIELDGDYKKYVELLGVGDEVDTIRNKNIEFKKLVKERDGEYAKKSKTTVSQAKRILNPIIRNVLGMIDSFAVAEGSPEYQKFIDNINIVFGRYSATGGSSGTTTETPAPETPTPETPEPETPTPETPIVDEYPDAIEWVPNFGVANAKVGDIFYLTVSGKKVCYRLLDQPYVAYSPDSDKGAPGWEKL